MRVLTLALLLVSGIGLQLINPQIIRYFIDMAQDLSADVTQGTLIMAGLLFLGVVIIERILNIATTYVSQTVAWTATNGLRRDLTEHVLSLDMGFHNEHTPGELLARIDNDVTRLANFFSEFLIQILTGTLLTIGVLALLMREDWRIGLALSFFVVGYVVVHTKSQAMAEPHWRKEREYVAELMSFVEERFVGVQDIQTSGPVAVTHTLRRFYEVIRKRTWQGLKADVVTDVAWAISKTSYELGRVAGLGIGAYLFINGTISLGTVYLVVHYLSMLNAPLNRIGQQMEDLQRVRVSITRVKALTETKPNVSDGPGVEVATNDDGASVRFRDVTFGYTPDVPVLHSINLNLAPGQTLGLLGRTGSGKTTLSRLLFRLYAPQQGDICLNDHNVKTFTLAQLRQQIGMVTQEVQLFPASVRDNLTLFDNTISDAVILTNLTHLGLDSWISSLPMGLDTEIRVAGVADTDEEIDKGDTGVGLSAGEAQLLALARVFLKDPSIVILDEASSRLDPATERLLEKALDTLLQGRTSIIIAHRLSTVQRADQILILDKGHVKELGDYAALASNPASVFAGLLQTGLEEVLA